VNRLDGEDKEYGYIIDYKDLFKSWRSRSRTTPAAPSTASTKEDVAGC
jgi:type I site-specific restriction endonuclease